MSAEQATTSGDGRDPRSVEPFYVVRVDHHIDGRSAFGGRRRSVDDDGRVGFGWAVAIGLYILWAGFLLLPHAAPRAWRRRFQWLAKAWGRSRQATISSSVWLFRFERNLLGGILAVWVGVNRWAVSRLRNLVASRAFRGTR